MSDPSLISGDPGGEQKRRSTRIAQAVPITVVGVDALGQPFKERTTTVTVNCHGCKYQSKHYVPKTSVVTLEISRPESGLPPRLVTGRVIWVQRPRTVRELFQIGLEFDTVGNVWGIAFPPEDWLPYPDEKTSEPASSAWVDIPIPTSTAPVSGAPVSAVPKKTEPHTQPPSIHLPAPAAPPAAPEAEKKIHLVPAVEPSQEAQLTVLREHIGKLIAEAKETIGKTARHDAQAAINDEMTVVRQQFDAQLHEAVERAIKVSMERVSESAAKKLLQQATERTNAIVEEARKTTEAGTVQLDLKIRQAVDQTVGAAAERAAQQAAEQAGGQNLQQSVKKAVERVISEREATSPSLKILSSPEAAQQHLDGWKRDLEQTAQTVRRETLEQTQADATAAAVRLHGELEAAIAGASQELGAKLEEVSLAKIAQAEADAAGRAVALRSSLDETAAGSQAAIQSLSAALEQERARAEETKTQLAEAAQINFDRARAGLDQLLSSHTDEIARKAEELSQARIAQAEADAAARGAAFRSSLDETIAERTKLVAPAIDDSAQRAIVHFSEEFDRTLGTKIGEAGRIASELSQAGQQAATLRSSLNETVAGSQATIQALNAAFEQGRARAEETKSHLDEAAQAAVERARARLDQLLSSQTDEIARKADEIIAERANLIAPAIEDSAQKAIAHFSEQLDHTLAPKIDEAGRLASELSQATQQAAAANEDSRAQMQQLFEHAAHVQTGLHNQIRAASEQAIAEALRRIREEASKAPAEVEQACQSAASKIEAEIDKRATEVQHDTYESLSKAADWYQKKAQTTMQSSLEKTVEQSAATLRDRAAEISSLVASELDHYRRTYAEHSHAEIEEAANEIVERERGRLGESADMVNAGFTDQVQHVAAESLRRFQQVSREALEKTRSDMEFNREGSLTEFQKYLERQMARGVLQAQTHLESQLAPLMEAWEAQRKATAAPVDGAAQEIDRRIDRAI